MQIDFKKSHFELFALPQQFDILIAELDRNFRALQSEVHPDRFAAAPDTDQRVALQWATRVNEAYQTLKNPLSRARYLLALQGTDTEEETNTAMPTTFLMEQMDWRERVASAYSSASEGLLDSVADELAAERNLLLDALRSEMNAGSWPLAALTVRKLRFLEKLGDEIEITRDALGV